MCLMWDYNSFPVFPAGFIKTNFRPALDINQVRDKMYTNSSSF